MATTQTPTSTKRSEAAKKAAATRAAKAAGLKTETQANMQAPTEQHTIPEEQRQGERRQQAQNALVQFQPTTQTTPAVHEQPSDNAEAIKQKAFQEAVQALANSMGVDPTQLIAPQVSAKQVKTRADRQQMNGITRPASGTVTGAIWDLADKLSAERGDGNPVEVAKLRAHAEMKQVNDHTLKTQFARWRSYHGIKGRTPAQASPAPEQPHRRADDPKPSE